MVGFKKNKKELKLCELLCVSWCYTIKKKKISKNEACTEKLGILNFGQS